MLNHFCAKKQLSTGEIKGLNNRAKVNFEESVRLQDLSGNTFRVTEFSPDQTLRSVVFALAGLLRLRL